MNSFFFGDAELFSPSMIRYLSKDFFLSAGRGRVHTCCECYNKMGYTYVVRIQNYIFRFPFDEIYRRLLFSTLGRSVSA